MNKKLFLGLLIIFILILTGCKQQTKDSDYESNYKCCLDKCYNDFDDYKRSLCVDNCKDVVSCNFVEVRK